MAEIVNTPTIASTGSVVKDTFAWFANYWWAIVIMVLLAGLLMGWYYLMVLREEESKIRDSPIYSTYHSLIKSAKVNSNDKWVRTRYSLVNLFWLGIPFKKKEHSLRITDVHNSLIGYYRGHTKTQNGDLVFLLYKTKSFLGLKEDLFVLYCPKTIKVPKVKNGKIVVKNDKTVYEARKLPEHIIQFDTRANEVRIKCNTIQKLGIYYYFPNYVVIQNDEETHLDLTTHISDHIAQQNFVVQMERAYSDFGKTLGRAVEVNPLLRYGQKEPEKEKKMEDVDED